MIYLILIPEQYPTVFYHKNYKGTLRDKDYFYTNPSHKNVSEELESGIQPLSDHQSKVDQLPSEVEPYDSVFKSNLLLTEITREYIAKKYRFEKVLGEGAFGKVKVASLRADASKKFAIKSIPRSIFTKSAKMNNKKSTDSNSLI